MENWWCQYFAYLVNVLGAIILCENALWKKLSSGKEKKKLCLVSNVFLVLRGANLQLLSSFITAVGSKQHYHICHSNSFESHYFCYVCLLQIACLPFGGAVTVSFSCIATSDLRTTDQCAFSALKNRTRMEREYFLYSLLIPLT